MKGYTLHRTANDSVFHQALQIIKRHNPNLTDEQTLQDVDGTVIYHAVCGNARVILKSETDVDCVCVEVDEGISIEGLTPLLAYSVQR